MIHTSMWFLHSLTVYFNVKPHDIWEGNVTTRREIAIDNVWSLCFWDISEGLTLRRVTL